MDTDCSTHPKGTNKKRARCFCFRYFAVVIRHLISRPQRTPKSSRNVTAKVWEPAKAPQRLRRLIPRWSDSRSLSKCYRWRRAFPLAFISGLTGAWQMITYQKVLSLCKFYRIQEAIIGENKVFHRLKSLTCRVKSSFMDKTTRIAERSFRIAIISTIFASNIQRVSRMKTIDNTPPDLSGRP